MLCVKEINRKKTETEYLAHILFIKANILVEGGGRAPACLPPRKTLTNSAKASCVPPGVARRPPGNLRELAASCDIIMTDNKGDVKTSTRLVTMYLVVHWKTRTRPGVNDHPNVPVHGD